ncbi:MAG TPA: HupE/UreJ family protein [Burkholderiales bacterium]|nr:HupE/UreJ family protein [Burkholderiales bacterium]
MRSSSKHSEPRTSASWRPFRALWLLLACLAAPGAHPAFAHEFKLDAVMNAFVRIEPGGAHLVIRAPLYLFKAAKFPVKGAEIDAEKAGPALERALGGIERDIALFEDGERLRPSSGRARLSLPSDRSFRVYEQAVEHARVPLEPGVNIVIDQGFVDADIAYPIRSTRSEFAVRTTAAPELGPYLKLAVRYMPPNEDARAMVITSGHGTVALNPGWLRAATGFAGLGITHILTGFDHLLFLLCLVIPLRGWRQILSVITVFTVAHSFTLLGSAFELAPSGAWFPPFVETMIAASIVFMALENIVGVNLQRRVLITGLFGLVHGFGFSYGLQQDLQFAGTHLLVSLFAFNVGIEIGQIAVLALMLPLLALVRRFLLAGRVGTIVMSALVAHTGWHWMLDRGEVLSRYDWPQPTLGALVTVTCWVAGILGAAALLRWIATRYRERMPAQPAGAVGGDWTIWSRR